MKYSTTIDIEEISDIYESGILFIIEEKSFVNESNQKSTTSSFYNVYESFLYKTTQDATYEYLYSFMAFQFDSKLDLYGCYVIKGIHQLYFIYTLLHSITKLLCEYAENNNCIYLKGYIDNYIFRKYGDGGAIYESMGKIRILPAKKTKNPKVVSEDTYPLYKNNSKIYKIYEMDIDTLVSLLKEYFTKKTSESTELDIELLEEFVKYILHSISVITIKSYNKNYTEQILEKLENIN